MEATQEPKTRILVVDDDPAARISLHGVLSQDFEVATAPDAWSALELLRNHEFEIVVTDYEMPGESGLQLLQAINANYPQMVTILLTGHTRHSEVRGADNDRNVFAVLGKPYNPAELLRSLQLASATARLRTVTHGRGKKP